jgi:hypothetical protein
MDDVFISTAAFDNRVVQIAGEKVNIGTAEDNQRFPVQMLLSLGKLLVANS